MIVAIKSPLYKKLGAETLLTRLPLMWAEMAEKQETEREAETMRGSF